MKKTKYYTSRNYSKNKKLSKGRHKNYRQTQKGGANTKPPGGETPKRKPPILSPKPASLPATQPALKSTQHTSATGPPRVESPATLSLARIPSVVSLASEKSEKSGKLGVFEQNLSRRATSTTNPILLQSRPPLPALPPPVLEQHKKKVLVPTRSSSKIGMTGNQPHSRTGSFSSTRSTSSGNSGINISEGSVPSAVKFSTNPKSENLPQVAKESSTTSTDPNVNLLAEEVKAITSIASPAVAARPAVAPRPATYSPRQPAPAAALPVPEPEVTVKPEPAPPARPPVAATLAAGLAAVSTIPPQRPQPLAARPAVAARPATYSQPVPAPSVAAAPQSQPPPAQEATVEAQPVKNKPNDSKTSSANLPSNAQKQLEAALAEALAAQKTEKDTLQKENQSFIKTLRTLATFSNDKFTSAWARVSLKDLENAKNYNVSYPYLLDSVKFALKNLKTNRPDIVQQARNQLKTYKENLAAIQTFTSNNIGANNLERLQSYLRHKKPSNHKQLASNLETIKERIKERINREYLQKLSKDSDKGILLIADMALRFNEQPNKQNESRRLLQKTANNIREKLAEAAEAASVARAAKATSVARAASVAEAARAARDAKELAAPKTKTKNDLEIQRKNANKSREYLEQVKNGKFFNNQDLKNNSYENYTDLVQIANKAIEFAKQKNLPEEVDEVLIYAADLIKASMDNKAKNSAKKSAKKSSKYRALQKLLNAHRTQTAV